MSDVIRGAPVSKQGNGNDSMTVKCSGHDRYLLVFINIVDLSAGDRALTIDFNGSNLTRLQGRTYSSGLAETEAWGLVNPEGGSHTLTWSFAGAITEYQIIALPLAQVDQSGPLDTGSGSAGSGTSRSISLTTSADRCQLYSFLAANNSVSAVSAGSGETEIATELDAISESHASEEDAVVTPAGNESIGWSWSGSHANAMEAVAIKPTANTILIAPTLTLGLNANIPAGVVTGKPPVMGAVMLLPNASTKMKAFAELLELGMGLFIPIMDFRMVAKLHAQARRRWFSGEGRNTSINAKRRNVLMITEKRNE